MQNGEDKQKQISISITKIFNWPENQTGCCFDLLFFPEVVDTPIIQKSVIGTYVSNSMNLNALLKITYTEDQKIIILKMLKNKKDKSQLLGQFQIDLDALRQKNVQYYPFGRDYVLQINLYNPLRSNSRISKIDQFSNSYQARSSRLRSEARLLDQERYLQERYSSNYNYGYNSFSDRDRERDRGRLSGYGAGLRIGGGGDRYQGYGHSRVYEPYQSRLKKSFSEKVFTLLQEVKSIKQDIMVGSRQTGRRTTQQPQNSFQPRFKKSMSDSKFKPYGSPTQVSPTFRRDQQVNANANASTSRGNKTLKHRLILSTLNVVPCQQYYHGNSNGNGNGSEDKQNQIRYSNNQQKVVAYGKVGSDYYGKVK